MPFRGALTRRLLLGRTLASLFVLPARAQTMAPSEGFRILEAREGSLRLLPEPAPEAKVPTFDGTVPGPLLRFAQGDEVKIRLVNRLDHPVTFSPQGLRVSNAMAGVAGLTQKPVAPGESFDYRFVARDAGLSWYHSHVLPRTREQVGRGLYGAMIVDEREPPPTDGDLLILLADWSLDERMPIDDAGAGAAAPLLTVNSRPLPLVETLPPRARLRLRLVSAVMTRAMFVTFSGAKPLVLAVDGAPCDPFEPLRQTIPVGPGASFDLVLDLPSEPGAEVVVSARGDPDPGTVLATFRTEGEPRAELPKIRPLAANPSLPSVIKLEASRKIDLVIEASDGMVPWKLDGVAVLGFPAKPFFVVKRGAPVTLGFVNRSRSVQQMRVHGHYLRLLHDLDDGWDPYWRNCVLVPEGKTKRVAFVADAPGKWAIEGLMDERRSAGLATWFEVL